MTKAVKHPIRPKMARFRWTAALALLLCASTAYAAPVGSPLADAVEKGDHTRVAALLKGGVTINAGQADGTTALHWAAEREDVATARQLVAVHADVNEANKYGAKPLSLACVD